MKQASINLRFPADLKRAVKARCALDGVTITAVIERLLGAWLDGDIPLPETAEEVEAS